jgi:hypothetical protein
VILYYFVTAMLNYEIKMDVQQYFVVEPNFSILELKEIFHRKFPNLFIDLYLNGDEIKEELFNLKLLQFGVNPNPKSFVITSEMSVEQVIEEFRKILGIKISVFRKLGNSNVEASFTSQWSLGLQNEKGGEMLI